MFVKQNMYNRILIGYITNCTSTNVQTAYCTESLNHLKTLNHLKLKILWLQIDLTNLDQLELEVSASYNTRWILTAKLDVIEQEVLKFLLQFVDWWCFALVSMPLSIFCQTYKKHPIYIKISTYGCDLFI